MRDKVFEIIAKQLEVEKSELTDDTLIYDDLGVDSMDLFSLLDSIEQALGIHIPNEVEVETIGDIVNVVEKLVA